MWLRKNKTRLMVLAAILIVMALTSKLIFKHLVLEKIAFLLAGIIAGLPIVQMAYQSLKIKVISIDILVSIAIIGAFVIQNFEEAAIVAFLFLFGSYLEQRTLSKTRSSIKELVAMVPDQVHLIQKDGSHKLVDIDMVEEGDRILVTTGDKVPVDGHVIKGTGYLNQASITGESQPIKVLADSKVFAGTILENGTLEIMADKVGEDTVFGKIIELVEDAQDSKSQAEQFINRFAKYYTPAVLILAIIVGVFSRSVELAITILVLGCPGALVIGVPISNVAGIGSGANKGILFKGSDVIYNLSHLQAIAFDKTGTLTSGKTQVVTFYRSNHAPQAIDYLLAVERESQHPLAKAIVDYFDSKTKVRISRTNVIKGQGIEAEMEGNRVLIGNLRLMTAQGVILTATDIQRIKEEESLGRTIVLMSINHSLEMIISISDTLRAEAKNSLVKLKELGLKETIILSGDNQDAVNKLASQLPITEARGQLLPADKTAFIRQEQENGKIIAFVGDGVNDSPSLAQANVGIAVGSGTDVAIETSDIVLLNDSLSALPTAVALSKAIYHNMVQNIVISLAVVALLITGLLFSNLVTMSTGMFVHEFSILLVILNGIRLSYFKE